MGTHTIAVPTGSRRVQQERAAEVAAGIMEASAGTPHPRTATWRFDAWGYVVEIHSRTETDDDLRDEFASYAYIGALPEGDIEQGRDLESPPATLATAPHERRRAIRCEPPPQPIVPFTPRRPRRSLGF